jgi:hypothetical protein
MNPPPKRERYVFSEAEILEIARRLARHQIQLARIEQAKKDANKDFNTDIKTEKAIIATLSEQIDTGAELREITPQRTLEFNKR